MSQSLPALEKDCSEIMQQITPLGDFRPGSIRGVMGRCSKPNGHCARVGDPDRGPNFRLTRKVHGKTVSETFPDPAALHKAQREVAAFHRFRELVQSFLEVNEKICRLRPVEATGEQAPTAQEKKRRKPFSGRWRKK